ncbi:hypothetical protein NDU88_011256 [Pleurodeles waltl]|uniref:Uncharacterized protein n=1 Tax=Pleurodeles waltl TaxID=8319 RepID=A0AAV7S6D9_PLEWA|nr:hypothetical protein NDU88_011256 [Pleurodeles waltl]
MEADMATAIQEQHTMVSTVAQLELKQKELMDKIEDLENCSQQNNLKFLQLLVLPEASSPEDSHEARESRFRDTTDKLSGDSIGNWGSSKSQFCPSGASGRLAASPARVRHASNPLSVMSAQCSLLQPGEGGGVRPGSPPLSVPAKGLAHARVERRASVEECGQLFGPLPAGMHCWI